MKIRIMEDNNKGNRYVVISRNRNADRYIVVDDTTVSLRDAQRLAYDWYDSDVSHMGRSLADEYWAYDRVKKIAYLPKYFEPEDQTFDYNLPVVDA